MLCEANLLILVQVCIYEATFVMWCVSLQWLCQLNLINMCMQEIIGFSFFNIRYTLLGKISLRFQSHAYMLRLLWSVWFVCVVFVLVMRILYVGSVNNGHGHIWFTFSKKSATPSPTHWHFVMIYLNDLPCKQFIVSNEINSA